MTTTSLSPVEKWEADFEKNPLPALDNLLLRRTYMGRLHRNETDEILFRLFHVKDNDAQHALDLAMQAWFKKYWTTPPPAISTSQWVEVLKNAFFTVQRLNLRESYQWLLRMYSYGCTWLRSLYLNPARDPEAALLRTLALGQKDQGLLPLWLRFCGLEEDLPLHYASIGLLGLRKLPDKDGEPPGDLPLTVFRGIVNLAEAISNQSRLRGGKEGEDFWFLECRAIMALYPRKVQYWIDHFYPLIYRSPESVAVKWLGKIIPELPKRLQRKEHRGNFAQPPSWFDFKDIRKLLEDRPLREIRPKLDGFLERHRSYAQQTGDADVLVRAFCGINNAILRQDADLALALVEEAFHWAPYNPFVWTTRAKVEAHRSKRPRAVGLLWEAKRRFPENPIVRSSLANELRKQGKYQVAEVIYRQAMHDFPGDVVCRTGLGEVLKAQNNLEEAEAVYRQTVHDFPDNVVCRTGLGEVLKAQNKLAEAEAVYRQTVHDFPGDVVCRTGLGEVLKAQNKLPEAEAVYRQAMHNFHDNVVCRAGLAGVLLQQGKKEEAINLLEETVKKFPDSRFIKEFLEKVRIYVRKWRLDRANTLLLL